MPDPPFSWGAAPSCDLVLPQLEQQHLRFDIERGRLWVTSYGTPLQTRLNGLPMATGMRSQWRPLEALTAVDVTLRATSSAVTGVRVRMGNESGLSWERVVESLDFTLGRSRECAVVIPRSRVSREHARVVYREGKLMIADLRSTTGTSINHERLTQPHALSHGDKISIDGVRLDIDLSFDRTANPFDDDEPPAWLFEGDANDRLATVADGLPLGDEEASGPRPAFVLEAQFAGTLLGRFEVIDTVVVGRAEDCSLSIDTPALALRHARFEVDGGSIFVHDLGSSRGTYVNGRRIDHTVLLEGDRVELGPVTFAVSTQMASLQEETRSARKAPFMDRTAEGTTVPTLDTVRSAEDAATPREVYNGPTTLPGIDDGDA